MSLSDELSLSVFIVGGLQGEEVQTSVLWSMCTCVCVGVCANSNLSPGRVFGHFDMPLFLELCKSFQTLHLFKGQKLFSVGEFDAPKVFRSKLNRAIS